MEKVERGLMVMKNGKAWAEIYSGGRSAAEYGWLNPADKRVKIYTSEFCTKTTDVICEGRHHTDELLTGELVKVERRTVVTVIR